MVVKILSGSASFSGVGYNERKVGLGVAELLEMTNFGYLQSVSELNGDDLRQFLINWSAKNGRIEKPQFHVAISCKGREYTQEQLLDIAHQYLRGMGYEGQPTLIYFHHDTDNNHLHIVTSRVDAEGKKINHNHERRRSQQVMNRIMRQDTQQETNKIINDALGFSFSSVNQFKAILEASGYECYEKDGQLNIKKDGCVQAKVSVEDIEKRCTAKSENDQRRARQIEAWLRKYQQKVSDKEELQKIMREKFGVQLIFHGKEFSPYGYTVVDFKARKVFKGGEVLSLKELLQFGDREKLKQEIAAFVAEQVKKNPYITTRELNKLLSERFGLKVKDGAYKMGGKKVSIDEDIVRQLEHNDKTARVRAFSPRTEAERDMLAKIFKIPAEELKINTSSDPADDAKRKATEETIRKAMEEQPYGYKERLAEQDIHIFFDGKNQFAVNFKEHTIYSMSDMNTGEKQSIETSKKMDKENDNNNSNYTVGIDDIASAMGEAAGGMLDIVSGMQQGGGGGGGQNRDASGRKKKKKRGLGW